MLAVKKQFYLFVPGFIFSLSLSLSLSLPSADVLQIENLSSKIFDPNRKTNFSTPIPPPFRHIRNEFGARFATTGSGQRVCVKFPHVYQFYHNRKQLILALYIQAHTHGQTHILQGTCCVPRSPRKGKSYSTNGKKNSMQSKE